MSHAKRMAIAALSAAAIACSSSTPAPTTPGTPTITALMINGGAPVVVGQSLQLTATAMRSDGSSQDVTGAATWQSSNANVATVSSTGLVTAQAAGTATISAADAGKSATQTITATAASGTLTLSWDVRFGLVTHTLFVASDGKSESPTSVGVSGGTPPYTFAVSGSFPTGDRLSTAGAVQGQLTTTGTYAFTVRAFDVQGRSGSASFTVIVDSIGTANPIQEVPVGSSFSLSQSVASGDGAPAAFSVIQPSPLWPGTAFSSAGNTATLSGTPPTAVCSNPVLCQAATFQTLVNVAFPGRTWILILTEEVDLVLAPATLPSATKGTAYSQTIAASGGQAPYSYSVTSGTLPGGLTLSASGVLSGTPAAAGSFTFTVTAVDSQAGFNPRTNAPGAAGSATYTITVSG